MEKKAYEWKLQTKTAIRTRYKLCIYSYNLEKIKSFYINIKILI